MALSFAEAIEEAQQGRARHCAPLHRYQDQLGVEPVCATLMSADIEIDASIHYASKYEPPSAQAVRDDELRVEIELLATTPTALGRPARPAAGRATTAAGSWTTAGSAPSAGSNSSGAQVPYKFVDCWIVPDATR